MDYSLYMCMGKRVGGRKTYINSNSQAKVKGVKIIKY